MYLHLLLWLLCVLYGSVFSIGKLALQHSAPIFLTAARMLLAGILLFIYLYWRNRSSLKEWRQHWRYLLIIAITSIYLTNVWEFWGLNYMSSGKTCFIYSLYPIFTAILSYFYFKERITLKMALGLGLGVLGFLPVLLQEENSEAVVGRLWFMSYAELALVGATIATSIGWIYMRKLVTSTNISPLLINCYSMLLGGLISLIHSYCTENWQPLPVSNWSEFMPYFLLLTLVSNIISYNLNGYLLKFFTATYISLFGLSQNFFAAFLGYIWLHETLGANFWLAVVIVSSGLFIYYYEELKREKIKLPL